MPSSPAQNSGGSDSGGGGGTDNNGPDTDDNESGGGGGFGGGRPGAAANEPAASLTNTMTMQTAESMLRQQILLIHRDKTLGEAERSRRIQQLISGGSSSRPSRGGPKVIAVYNQPGEVRPEERIPMYHDEERTVFGCKHYMRSVKLQSHCCGKWVVCRFCHDEVSDHAIVRQKTRLMMCMRCFTVQPCSQNCVNLACGVRVSRYYCNDCKLWDDDTKKNIYHCQDCGICRIGRGLGQDYFHCKKCNVCMAIGLRDRHKCIERNLESDCPICGEYMFTSTTTVIFMPCGHCIHHRCYQEHIQTSYTCPTCCRSLGNMSEYFSRIDVAVASHRMPADLADQMSLIFCNDCEQRSTAKFHFMFHKCSAQLPTPTVSATLPATATGAAIAQTLDRANNDPNAQGVLPNIQNILGGGLAQPQPQPQPQQQEQEQEQGQLPAQQIHQLLDQNEQNQLGQQQTQQEQFLLQQQMQLQHHFQQHLEQMRDQPIQQLQEQQLLFQHHQQQQQQQQLLLLQQNQRQQHQIQLQLQLQLQQADAHAPGGAVGFGGFGRMQHLPVFRSIPVRLCGSYNTRLLQTYRRNTPEELEIASRLSNNAETRTQSTTQQ